MKITKTRPMTRRLYVALYNSAFVFRVTREKNTLYGLNDRSLKRELTREGGLILDWSYRVKLLRSQKKILVSTRTSMVPYVMTFKNVKQFDAYVSGLVVMWNTSWYTIKCMPKAARLRRFAYSS